MNLTLVSIGRAQLQVIGLNPQSVGTISEGRVPGRPTFSGMDHQLTGLGERVTAISALTYPLVTGGMDALGWLQRHHEEQAVVNMIRLGANWLGQMMGPVVIRTLEIDENQFHPFTGVGRRMGVEIDLVHVSGGLASGGGGVGGGLATAGRFFGGLFNDNG